MYNVQRGIVGNMGVGGGRRKRGIQCTMGDRKCGIWGGGGGVERGEYNVQWGIESGEYGGGGRRKRGIQCTMGDRKWGMGGGGVERG